MVSCGAASDSGNREALKKSRLKNSAAVDNRKRILNVKKVTLFGPIFICSCCKRQLFENGATKITTSQPNFIQSTQEELVEVRVNGSDHKTGLYICSTCQTAMLGGKVPSMAEINGLELVNIEDDCHLTELENNLIALNLKFQYIFCFKYISYRVEIQGRGAAHIHGTLWLDSSGMMFNSQKQKKML